MSKRGKQFYKVAIVSDLHSIFLDEKAFDLFLQIYADNDFDHLVINGDLLDFPTISSHAKKIESYNPDIIRDYSLDEELDYTEEMILQPLYNIGKKKRVVLVRMGNHEVRWLRPTAMNTNAIAEILETSRRRGSMDLENLLNFNRYNATISYNDIDLIMRRFVLTHGHKLARNRCQQYVNEFLMSGSSGHTHRLDKFQKALFNQPAVQWVESGCLRTFHKGVEFMGQGSVPDWHHGFVSVWFHRNRKETHVRQHRFTRNYSCVYGETEYRV